jgi:uncharacterized protein involved in outer membrane biogenesis
VKKWFWAAGAVIAVLVVLVAVGVSSLGPIIKKAVNSQGPAITGTSLQVGDVDIALLSGRASLQDFLIGNPEGFDSPYAVSVKAVKVDLDEKSLTKDTIVIDRIEVVAPRIIFEKTGRSDNFKALLRNVKKSVGGADTSKKQTSDESGKKLLIREFVVRDGEVKLAVKGLKGKEIRAALPEIRLQNIGQGQGGVTPAQAAKQIFTALYGKMTSGEMTAALQKSLSDLQGELPDVKGTAEKELGTAKERAAQGVESAKESFKGLFGE